MLWEFPQGISAHSDEGEAGNGGFPGNISSISLKNSLIN
jgi:hypothetical protein